MPHDQLNRIRRTLLKVEDGILVLLLGTMILLAALQIILRNLWDSGIPWGDPLLRTLVLWVAMVGVMVATRHREHIKIDLLSRYLPTWLEETARRATDLFAALACGLFSWQSGRFVLFEWQDGTRFYGEVPAWLPEVILPIGFGVLAARFLIQALSRSQPGEEA